MVKNKNLRLHCLSAVFLIAASLLTAKLFFVQMVRGEDYRTEADREYKKPANKVFDRGTIYFTNRDGQRVSGATVQSGYSLIINPTQLKTPEAVYNALTAIVPLDYVNFLKRAKKLNDPYEELAEHLTAEQAATIRNLRLAGVQLVEENWRFYPGGILAAHLLGRMSSQGGENDYAGQYGLEKQYDQILRRDEPLGFSNFLGHFFWGLADSPTTDKQFGNIVTTIEPTVENFLEQELNAIDAAWHPKLIGGIVMDPKTGAILALGARPGFDPGGKQFDIKNLTNPLIQGAYEMGSIIKPLTMSAGLDAKVVTPDSTYDDRGTIDFGNQEIGNWDRQGRGVVSMQEVLNQSLNTGAIYVMQQLGVNQFEKYFQAFGLLGEKTGIDLPGEIVGQNNFKNHRAVEYATASFGQGISMTPLTALTALSSLANDGQLVKPFVTKEIDYENQPPIETKSVIKRQVIAAETAKAITAMLVKVGDKALSQIQESLPRYQVAAKTGTAQISNPSGGYYSDRYLHSFFGYFPASQPRFSVFLFAVEPQGAEYAFATLTKPFFNLTKFLLNYYQIAPDR
ncbi:MAG: penicillin-binding protein 2 [Candidatus Vogelbacteria bacterium]